MTPRTRRFLIGLAFIIGPFLLYPPDLHAQFRTGGIQLRGYLDAYERTAPSVSGSGVCRWYADSTAHALKFSCNTGSFLQIATLTGTETLTNKTLTTPTANDIRGVSRITSTAALAPTISVTGFGTGPSAPLSTGSSDLVGRVNVTAGTTPGTSGTITVTFSSALGANGSVCVATLANGDGTWNPRATVITGSMTTTAAVFNWDNNSVNLTNAATYALHYVCMGR